MTPGQYCQDKAAQSGSSFYYSFLFLPSDKRRAITALYAFCREVDDIADECSDVALAQVKLAWWRGEIASVYGGQPQHPVAQALAAANKTFSLPQDKLHEIMDGMEMDLTQNRYPDFSALKLYCQRVAAVVGELSAAIFGYSDRRTLDYARNLGMAFQLTNIIRDVGEDARRDRIYLPLDELARFGVSVADILGGQESPQFKQLVVFQMERAQDYYERAFASLPTADRNSQRAGLIMAAIYRALLREIKNDGCRVLTQRVSLTPLRKFWIAWKTYATA
ncbi:MAG: presqualene diphosphate synthase HpnD [Burkholderiales bacterium]